MTVRPEDLARTLVDRTRALRAEDAERARAARAEVEAVLGELLLEGAIAEAWLIGSIVWGGFGAHSDVDIVVSGLDEESAPRVRDRIGACCSVVAEVLRLEDLPPTFRERVVRDGARIHGA